jgi:hypothetical protein
MCAKEKETIKAKSNTEIWQTFNIWETFTDTTLGAIVDK